MTHVKDATKLEFPDNNFQIFAWAFESNVKIFDFTKFKIKFHV